MGRELDLSMFIVDRQLFKMKIGDVIGRVKNNLDESGWEEFFLYSLYWKSPDCGRLKKDAVIMFLVDLERAICEGNRELVHLRFGEIYVFLAGGMSSGDAPSDTYVLFDNVYLMPKQIQRELGIKDSVCPFRFLNDMYGDKMPGDLKQRLLEFQVSLKIDGSLKVDGG